MEKQCSKCGVVKPANEFHKNSRRPDGLQRYCKPCKSENDKTRAHKIRAHVKKNPVRRRAHHAVERAIKSGDIVALENCSECGTKARLDGHHDDYAKPLNVRWLCRGCHQRWHAENEVLNG